MDIPASAVKVEEPPGPLGAGALLEAVRSLVERVLGALCAVLLASMVLVVFANVVARYWVNASIGWSEEVSRFMFIWVTFLGSVLAFRKGEHLGLDLLVKALPATAAHVVLVAGDLLVVGALAYLTIGGVDMTADSLASGWVSSAVPVPYGYVYLVVPVSFALMLLDGVAKTVLDVRTAFPGRREVEPC